MDPNSGYIHQFVFKKWIQYDPVQDDLQRLLRSLELVGSKRQKLEVGWYNASAKQSLWHPEKRETWKLRPAHPQLPFTPATGRPPLLSSGLNIPQRLQEVLCVKFTLPQLPHAQFPSTPATGGPRFCIGCSHVCWPPGGCSQVASSLGLLQRLHMSLCAKFTLPQLPHAQFPSTPATGRPRFCIGCSHVGWPPGGCSQVASSLGLLQRLHMSLCAKFTLPQLPHAQFPSTPATGRPRFCVGCSHVGCPPETVAGYCGFGDWHKLQASLVAKLTLPQAVHSQLPSTPATGGPRFGPPWPCPFLLIAGQVLSYIGLGIAQPGSPDHMARITGEWSTPVGKHLPTRLDVSKRLSKRPRRDCRHRGWQSWRCCTWGTIRSKGKFYQVAAETALGWISSGDINGCNHGWSFPSLGRCTYWHSGTWVTYSATYFHSIYREQPANWIPI